MSNMCDRVVNDYGPVTLSESEQYVFESKIIGKEFRIFVDKPFDIGFGEKRANELCPAIYLLDANTSFLMIAQIARMLQSTGELPPAYIFGIGYPGDDLVQFVNRRLQEFTPTADPDYKAKCDPSGNFIVSDGGDASLFLQFIQQELKPFIESKYPVEPSDSTLVGDSLGGLFTLYALFNDPDAFKRYVIGSPTIFWDKGTIWKHEQQCAQNYQQLDLSIFMGVGALEDENPVHVREENREEMSKISMVEDMRTMAKKILGRGYEKLNLDYQVFDGETHVSVIAPCLGRGLRTVFQQ